jgi:prepilin-type N-terminal cleavage/methylation domain-containing protein/prepilin-type processing-associated H-X9-DG protein
MVKVQRPLGSAFHVRASQLARRPFLRDLRWRRIALSHPMLGNPWGRGARRIGPAHAAFTLVELLVVIAIIGVLLSLLIPAVMSSRESGRKVTCANNMHNLALGVLNNTEANRRFPASGYFNLDPQSAKYNHAAWFGWVVPLLSFLERSDIAEQWDYGKPWDDPVNLKLGSLSVSVLACPDDDTVMPGQGNLSYVVNGGIGWTTNLKKGGQNIEDCPVGFRSPSGTPPYAQSAFRHEIDLSGDGTFGDANDKAIFYQMTLFFVENWPRGVGTVRHHTPDSVFDGLSNTLMLSENIRTGYDPINATNWSSPHPRYNTFCLSPFICDNWSCSDGHVDYSRANNRFQQPYQTESINAGRDQPEGESPWPSSRHPGGVYVAFCDGHIQFMSEEIDGAVYAALMSPQGSKIKGPLTQPQPFPQADEYLK